MDKKVNYVITGENKLSKILRQVDGDAQQAEQSINSISQSSASSGGGGLMGTIVGANLLTGAIKQGAEAVYNFGKESLDAYAKTESYQSRLTTLLGSQKEAEMALANYRTDAAKTPFDLESLVQGNTLLIGSGASAKEARQSIMDLGNAIAATGGGSDELSRMAVNLGQIRTIGKATQLDIKQFAYAGIPIYELLSRSMKKPIAQVKEMDVTYKDLTKALADARKEGGMFVNGLENASNTIQGLQSNLDDTIQTLKSNIGETFADSFKEGIRGLLPYLNDLNETLASVNKSSKTLDRAGLGYKWSESNSTRGDMAYFQRKVDEVSQFAQQGEPQAEQAKKSLKGFLKQITDTYLNEKEISEATGEEAPDSKKYLREVALLQDTIAGIDQTLKKTEDKSIKGGSAGADEKLGTGVTIEAQQPKNQYITINGGLVHEMKIESIDGDIPAGQIKEQISTALVELLNDAYTAMR